MKKTIMCLIAAVTVLSITACGDKNPDDSINQSIEQQPVDSFDDLGSGDGFDYTDGSQESEDDDVPMVRVHIIYKDDDKPNGSDSSIESSDTPVSQQQVNSSVILSLSEIKDIVISSAGEDDDTSAAETIIGNLDAASDASYFVNGSNTDYSDTLVKEDATVTDSIKECVDNIWDDPIISELTESFTKEDLYQAGWKESFATYSYTEPVEFSAREMTLETRAAGYDINLVCQTNSNGIWYLWDTSTVIKSSSSASVQEITMITSIAHSLLALAYDSPMSQSDIPADVINQITSFSDDRNVDTSWISNVEWYGFSTSNGLEVYTCLASYNNMFYCCYADGNGCYGVILDKQTRELLGIGEDGGISMHFDGDDISEVSKRNVEKGEGIN